MRNIKDRIISTNIGTRFLLKYHYMRQLFLSRLTDKEFAQRIYRKKGMGKLNLDKPKTFDEKLWWLKINYRDSLMTDCTDKVKVRNYVKAKGLKHILNEVYGVYDSSRSIDWDNLPKQFYLKTNHTSATNIFIDDINTVNKKYIEKRLNLFLQKKHYPLSREWNYRDITPKVIAEKTLNNNTGLVDYRFVCSYGEFKGLFVDIETADEKGNHNPEARRNVYDENFELLDITVTRPRIESPIVLPSNIEKMKEYAEILSEPFPFCRVDLYNINGEIVFGELTFFHAGGVNRIEPKYFEKVLGDWISLPMK